MTDWSDHESTTNKQENSEERDPLNPAQLRIVSAVIEGMTGLFVQIAVAGGGKTYSLGRLVSTVILNRYASGRPQPTAGVWVTVFNRSAASDLRAEIDEWLTYLVKTDATSSAAQVSEKQCENLQYQLRASETIGTIDALIRRVFMDIAAEVGFSEEVTVGGDTHVRELHTAAFEFVEDCGEVDGQLERLYNAYQDNDEEEDRVAEMLQDVFSHTREYQWSAVDLREHLFESRNRFYPDGCPESFDDIVDDVERFAGADAAEEMWKQETSKRQSVVGADQRLYEEWSTAIEALVAVFEVYQRAYNQFSREQDIVAHRDCAYWVASYFSDPELAHRIATDHSHQVIARRRQHLRERWQSNISLLVIDEAQDVSTGQHSALQELVDEDTRVVLYGDPTQLIYQWRDANRNLFQNAIQDGEYFGRSWDTHVVETADRTYRQLPALSHFTNNVLGQVFGNSASGSKDGQDTYTPLQPHRDETSNPHLHISTFNANGSPYDDRWHNPVDGPGSGGALAEYLRGGLSDNTFSGSSSPVLLLFRAGHSMPAVRTALEDRGLSVGATEPLFSHPITTAVVAVLRWLEDPCNREQTKNLFSTTPFNDSAETRAKLRDQIAAADWTITDAATQAESQSVTQVLETLTTLAKDIHRRRRDTVTDHARTILDTLIPGTDARNQDDEPTNAHLVADPLNLAPDTTASRRLTIRDALITYLNTATLRTDSFSEALTELEHLLSNPSKGPDLPVDAANNDVVFRTVHSIKGGEAPVVALADPAAPIHKTLHQKTLVTHNDTLALRPPQTDTSTNHTISGYDNGLFKSTVSRTYDSDSGLRWFSNQQGELERYIGPPEYATILPDKRAEEWRVLYVALTRARDHLIIPLDPHADNERDSWINKITNTLNPTDLTGQETRATTFTRPDGSETTHPISINDVSGRGPFDSTPDLENTTQSTPIYRTRLSKTTSPMRFVYPSTLHPLITNYDEHVLDHLLNRELNTDSGQITDNHPLPFRTLTPGDVGQIAHNTITSLIRKDATTEIHNNTADTVSDNISWAIRRQLNDLNQPIDTEERNAIHNYLRDEILPKFADSPLHDRLQKADKIFIEERLDSRIRINGTDVNLQGQADLITYTNDHWRIEDLKLALTEGTAKTNQRYRVQLAIYEWILCQQEDLHPNQVDSTLTYLGESSHPTEIPSTIPIEQIEQWFQHLVPNRK